MQYYAASLHPPLYYQTQKNAVSFIVRDGPQLVPNSSSNEYYVGNRSITTFQWRRIIGLMLLILTVDNCG